jgi:hypothetical protein
MHIEQPISLAEVGLSEFILAFETEWNPIAHLLQSSAVHSYTYCKIMKDLVASQEATRYFLLAWLAESHDNVVENLSSHDHLNNACLERPEYATTNHNTNRR